MRISKNKTLYSPTDLNNFVSCKYHIKNDLTANDLGLKKKEKSADLKLRIEYGKEHEKEYFRILSKKHKKNITIDPKQPADKKYKETIKAIKSGYDLIYKAYLMHEDFGGEIDFLIKHKSKSKLGDFSYEVYDTKVTKTLRPKHALQTTGYSFLLGKVQGLIPKRMHLVDGTKLINSFNVSEFIDYFSFTKKNFEKFLTKVLKEKMYPEKCSFCNICDWQDVCTEKWDKDNYINQVCGIRSSQVTKLKKENISTIQKLAKTDPKKIKSKINPGSKVKLTQQAQLQEEKRLTNKSKYIFNKTDSNKGFYKMPKPNEGDVFYDIEGFPQAEQRPFEYLHGIYFYNGKEFEFKYFIVKEYTRKEEEQIFRELVAFLEKHFNKYPNGFLYHYNVYEKRALRELASDYSATFIKGNNFVDRLLRLEKFVDLYRVVSQSMQTSEKDLTLKTIEKFYRDERSTDIKTADDSIQIFESWLVTKNKKDLKDIIVYNEEDCISSYDLREFLIKHRPDDFPFFKLSDDNENKNADVKDFELKEAAIQLKVIEKSKDKDTEVKENLKHLVGFHRRENKSKYWAKFDRLDKSPDELLDDPECIGGAIFIKKSKIKDTDNHVYLYRFDEQNFKLKEGDTACDVTSDLSFGKITKIDEIKDDENYIELTITSKRIAKVGEPPKLFDFGPGPVINTATIASALNKFILNYTDGDKSKFKCGLDIIKKDYPDLKKIKKGDPIINDQNDLVEESIEVVKKMNSSYLLVQGPPGSGKTYTSAKIILSLLKDNKRIGITSNSHKAINNLLHQIEKFALEENFSFKGMKKSSKDEDKLKGEIIKDVSGRMIEFPSEYLLHAGTAWLFSDPRWVSKMDYLFVDEAGQVSLANTLAISTSTKNIILIGDQMQLSQPIQGIHSGNSGKSSLDFLLGDYDTIPLSRGIFLDVTRRLNEKICDYISSSFYESRLKSHPVTKDRSVSLELKEIKDEGIFYLPVDHQDCTQKSDEEAKIIKDYCSKILGKNYTEDNKKKKMTIKNIMIIAPFNMQVNNLKKILNRKEARIGTIDKFQGQESKVVFISMTSSDPENLPRHKEFFFSRNRLNVAISRAQCVAVILFNPNLLLADCKKINEMRLINNFCKLLKYEKIN